VECLQDSVSRLEKQEILVALKYESVDLWKDRDDKCVIDQSCGRDLLVANTRYLLIV
jgi:hypothetical protein